MKGATGGQCQTPARECRPRNIPTTREATTTKRIRNQDGRYTSHYRNGGRFNAAACKATSNEKKKQNTALSHLCRLKGVGKGVLIGIPPLVPPPGSPSPSDRSPQPKRHKSRGLFIHLQVNPGQAGWRKFPIIRSVLL